VIVRHAGHALSGPIRAGPLKTRSGKILGGTMRKIADGEDYPMPATIDDPAVLGQIESALTNSGCGRGPRPSR